MKPHYHGHRSRLKEKFRENPSSLADYEIVELLLGYSITRRDVKPQAKSLIEEGGGIAGIFRAASEGAVDGIGPETGLYLTVIRELMMRVSRFELRSSRISLDTPEAVQDYLKHRVGFRTKEQVIALFLDPQNRYAGEAEMGSGTVDRAVVFPREVAEAALKHNAAHVILAHNHPSGEPFPSDEDIAMTDAVKGALGVLGITLLDHVILAADRHFSFAESRLI